MVLRLLNLDLEEINMETAAQAPKFKLDMEHLQKVQRTLRKAGNIFPNEKPLIETLEDLIIKAQDDTSLNTYYSMAQYLKQRVKNCVPIWMHRIKILKRHIWIWIGQSIIFNGW